MHGDDHQCEVRERDLSGLRFDLERAIDNLQAEMRHLRDRVRLLQERIDDLETARSA